MPAMSSTMKEGRVVEWLKSEGEPITAGESIATIESDKADMDMEAFEDGFLAKILVLDGEIAQVGDPIALVASTKDEIASVVAAGVLGAGASPSSTASNIPLAPPSPATPSCQYEEIFMPALSSTMTTGKVVSWEVIPGSKITSGDPLLTVESDKADMEVEHLGDDGWLAGIVIDEGEGANVGATLAVVATAEKDLEELRVYVEQLKCGGGGAVVAASTPVVNAPAPPAASASKVSPSPSPPPSGGRVIASPLAKKKALELNVDLSTLSGTGENGRITASDVSAASKNGGSKSAKTPAHTHAPANTHIPAPNVINATPMARVAAKKANLEITSLVGSGEFGRVNLDDVMIVTGEKSSFKKQSGSGGKAAIVMPSGLVPFSGMQRAVSGNMEKTLGVPIFRVSRSICTDAFDELYQKVKPKGVTVSALLAKAVSLAIEKHPIMNSNYDASGGIMFNENVNIAMAVALNGGLITPVLKNANFRNIEELGADWKDLISKARAGTLSPDEYNSGTFAISNLGMFGVSSFEAILPPGMGSILAIGGTVETVVPDKRAVMGLRVEKRMTVTITCDHRPIYGSDAAEFLKTLASIMSEKSVDRLLD